jgi:hypothetical protein
MKTCDRSAAQAHLQRSRKTPKLSCVVDLAVSGAGIALATHSPDIAQ